MTKTSRRFVVFTVACLLILVLLYRRTSSYQKPILNQPKVGRDMNDGRTVEVEYSVEVGTTPIQKRSHDDDDPGILDYIRRKFLLPPSTKSYNFTDKYGKHVTEFSAKIEEYFKRKINGTFVEVGAYDGERASNTLYFELNYGWTGILIECNPLLVSQLVSKNRKAWIAQACLSTTDRPETVNLMTLKEWPASAQLNKPLSDKEMAYWGLTWVKDKHWYNYSLPAFPLYSIILATKAFPEIDFLSLDVQGIEIKVLKNFPFEKFNIKYILAEVALFSQTEKQEVKDLMASKGYKFLTDFGNGFDYSFGRESMISVIN